MNKIIIRDRKIDETIKEIDKLNKNESIVITIDNFTFNYNNKIFKKVKQ
jgi:hypothetical protein